jgi:succinoglycan biosynthesis transport protein ExoP
MSQELQLTTSHSSGDYWTQGQTAAGGGTAPRQSPLKKAHRLLRGRYPLAFLLGAIGAIAGATACFVALPPKYQSSGLIMINPVISGGGPNDSLMPMMNLQIGSQSAIIQSTGVAEEAIKSKEFADAWIGAYSSTPVISAIDFAANVDAEKSKTGTIITVSFTDKNRDVARAGTRAVIAAYMKLHGNTANDDRQKKVDMNEKTLASLRQAIDVDNEDIQKASKYGTTDLTVMASGAQGELGTLENELSLDNLAYENALQAQTKMPALPKGDPEYVYQQIAAIDQGMHQKLEQRDEMIDKFQATMAEEQLLSNNPRYQAGQINIQFKRQEIENYARNYLEQHPNLINADIPTLLKNKCIAAAKLVAEHQKKVTELGEAQTKIEGIRRKVAREQQDEDLVNSRIQALTEEQALTIPVEVEDHGSEAEITGDAKRKTITAAGFLFGGMMPVGLLMLYGMVDLRFRYSDEANDADLAGVALLGILPNLPDRLSDPQQAGIAAHCVHQIRTMLQINRTNDEPQVVAITSAAPGDGKTSLTLALGLSYAACGARTLLVDCDLVAAGLSHRLNVNAPDGVLEAVANRALLEYVRTTDIADVAILPVGTTHAHHASTLSPVALRRLLNESKKHFDIILVDTGPILGSIEASLVCAAADRTILTVARGQQRPLVERSIGHLQAIGSRLAGVVFNRAQARDFERSLSGIALRSRSTNTNVLPPETPHTPPTKNNAGSFKRAG